MKKIRTNVAGIDIGAAKVFTSIEGQPVVSHLTFTADFYLLRDYLLNFKVESVAMEATVIKKGSLHILLFIVNYMFVFFIVY